MALQIMIFWLEQCSSRRTRVGISHTLGGERRQGSWLGHICWVRRPREVQNLDTEAIA